MTELHTVIQKETLDRVVQCLVRSGDIEFLIQALVDKVEAAESSIG